MQAGDVSHCSRYFFIRRMDSFKPRTSVSDGINKFVTWYKEYYGGKNEINLPDIFYCKVGIIGIGYVGLPLAVEIAKVKMFKYLYEVKENYRF